MCLVEQLLEKKESRESIKILLSTSASCPTVIYVVCIPFLNLGVSRLFPGYQQV